MNKVMPFELHAKLAQDSFLIGQLELSSLLLINDQQFPWFVLVPRVNDIGEIYQLSRLQQSQLWIESARLSQLIMQHFAGDKLNVAAIGNLVPQLHLHHVVRFKTDVCWPAPIWGKRPMEHYSPEKAQLIQQNIAAKMPELRTSSI